MSGDETLPSATVTRKPDDDVGARGPGAAEGGKQSAQQARLTGMGADGRDDADRSRDRDGAPASAGRNPVPKGGSSQGQSDTHSADDAP